MIGSSICSILEWISAVYKKLISFQVTIWVCCLGAITLIQFTSILVRCFLASEKVFGCTVWLFHRFGRKTVLHITIKCWVFCLIKVYALNSHIELAAFLWWIEQFMNISQMVIFVGDWNTVLDPDWDRLGLRVQTILLCLLKSLILSISAEIKCPVIVWT